MKKIRIWLMKKLKAVDVKVLEREYVRSNNLEDELNKTTISRNRLLIENILYENGVPVIEDVVHIQPVIETSDGTFNKNIKVETKHFNLDNFLVLEDILIELALSGLNYDLHKRHTLINTKGFTCYSLQDIRSNIRR